MIIWMDFFESDLILHNPERALVGLFSCIQRSIHDVYKCIVWGLEGWPAWNEQDF